MYKATGKETIPLTLVGYCWWIEDQVVNDLTTVETCKRDQDCNYYDNECDGHGLLVRNSNLIQIPIQHLTFQEW